MLAPRILNDVSYVTRINHEIHFAWQAQYLVKLECDFSWQAQHLVTSKVSEAAGARCDFLIGLSSDCRRIVFLLAESIHGVSAEVLNLQISWQAQYLVRLVADCACSAHCK